ncbi:MAG: molybdopterin-dependent oxidoreductase, partial [Rhodospirillaceae bacterium]|nr:molybdopterin-dependent oxidoreductase [Rhodospirillaceae bacterium]
MSELITFTLDGREVAARPGETIWQVAEREGIAIPHLCHRPKPGYRPDGNCRACVVEVAGERTLAASCIRTPRPGMVVSSESARAQAARSMVFELLLADQPPRQAARDADSAFWGWADRIGLTESRLPSRDSTPAADRSHPAMAVHLDACIQCNLCVRACREVQVNDVIGMAARGHDAKIVFDFDDPMGASTCVGCGECVQACPTGALMPASVMDAAGHKAKVADRTVDTLCPYCGVGCQTRLHIKDDRVLFAEGRDGPSNTNRLCVKGRFGFDYINHPQRLTVPLIRREDAPKGAGNAVDPANPYTHFREATWEEALDRAAAGLKRIRDTHGPGALAGFGSAKGSNEEAYLFQKLVRTGFGTNNVDHCTRLCHASSVAALMENVGSGAVTATVAEVRHAEVIVVIGANPTVNHPVAATFIKNAAKRGAKLVVMDPRGSALSRHADHMLQFRAGADVTLLNSLMHVIVEEALTDQQYIAGFTEGFPDVAAKVAEFAPEKMEAISGIPADTVRTVARLYARA